MISRRIFVRNGALALVGLGSAPSFLVRSLLASGAARGKILVVIFQRGGMDGLNVVVPFGEKSYYRGRPRIAIPAPAHGRASALDLDGFFGLHPALEPLLELYRKGDLGILDAVGSPDATRSHFDAQDFMESGAPGQKSVRDGWLNRYLAETPRRGRIPFRAVAMGSRLPRSLKGRAPALSLGNVRSFRLGGPRADAGVESVYRSLYDAETSSLLSGTAREMFEAIDLLRRARLERFQPVAGARYPRGRFGQSLLQVAQLIKAEVGLEVAFVDLGGWDHHVNEGAVTGQLANRLRELGQGLAAFYRDLGDRMEEVVVVTMSEFGRTARENGNAGTDHGHANVMFLLGGAVRGGRVYGRWPGLAPEQLYQRRDLALTTDFRDLFAEILTRHLGLADAGAVFPGFHSDPTRFPGLFA